MVQSLVNIRIKNKTVNGHDNLNTIKNKDNDLVFLGSSRCFAHFDPALFGKLLRLKAVNIGVDGHSELPIHILRLSNYLAKNKSPRFAILNLDPFVSVGSFDSNANPVHKNAFARYAYFSSSADEPIVRYFHFNFAERHMPLYALLKYKQFFDCLTLSNVDNSAIYGYERHEEVLDTVANPIHPEKAISYYFDTSNAEIHALSNRIDSLKSLCIANNIFLICVQTPVYKDIYIKKYFDVAKGICRNLEIPFFDLNNDSIDGNLKNFYNVNHMNVTGVRCMTEALCSDPAFANLFSRDQNGKFSISAR
jgi:hypothetical protein